MTVCFFGDDSLLGEETFKRTKHLTAEAKGEGLDPVYASYSV